MRQLERQTTAGRWWRFHKTYLFEVLKNSLVLWNKVLDELQQESLSTGVNFSFIQIAASLKFHNFMITSSSYHFLKLKLGAHK